MAAGATIDLNGTWELAWQDGERGPARRPGVQERVAAAPKQAFQATVPGEVHLDLMAAGVLQEPVSGLNCLAARWVEEAYWIYRRTFHAPALAPGERAFLVFDRLELAAVVRVNGAEAGRHANTFYPLRLEVTQMLRAGENLLAVELESGVFSACDRPWDGWGVNAMGRLTKRHWLRTVQSSAAWDWSQRLLNVGITGAVRLEIRRGVRTDGCSVVAELQEGFSRGTAKARVFLEGLDERTRQGTLTVKLADPRGRDAGRTERAVAVNPGSQTVEVVLPVEHPDLWQPVGRGEPALYTALVTLAVEGDEVFSETRRIGFRRVRVNQDPHPDGGRYFILEVNGAPLFCKGGDFVPADPIPARLDRDRYKILVDRALEANFTMLRVWGGGLYESGDFYDLCDEKGILVWQEFIFACAKYPATDESFLADVRREARHQVRRLAHHASLVVWCGNNELEWGDWSWGYGERGVCAPDHFLYHVALPRILAEEDGSRYYQPSSPYSPDLHPPNCDDCGDQHPWSVGMQEKDFRKYRAMACRFPNEGGYYGPVSLPTLRECFVPGQEKPHSFSWEVHENSIAIPSESDESLEMWLGVRMQDLSLEDWAYQGGLLQGAALSEYIRNFRRRMFSTSSAVFWMYNDCWPMVRSWTIVDYRLRRTPSFHPVRRAFAPLTVALAVENGMLKVFCVNDGPAVPVEVRHGLTALAGGFPVDERRKVTAAGNASTLIAELPEDRWRALGERSHAAFALLYREGTEVARDTLFLPLYKEMQWPQARVTVRRAGGKAVFLSDTFAWRVCLDLDGERRIPDNFFDLLPGIPYELDWPAGLGEPRVLRVGN